MWFGWVWVNRGPDNSFHINSCNRTIPPIWQFSKTRMLNALDNIHFHLLRNQSHDLELFLAPSLLRDSERTNQCLFVYESFWHKGKLLLRILYCARNSIVSLWRRTFSKYFYQHIHQHNDYYASRKTSTSFATILPWRFSICSSFIVTFIFIKTLSDTFIIYFHRRTWQIYISCSHRPSK